MNSLPDAERDARDVVQALADLAALLKRASAGAGEDSARRVLVEMAEDGGNAAVRVLAYLRSLRGAGDGEAAVVPLMLGPWRDWIPGHGGLFGQVGPQQRIGGLPQPRRSDPGE